MYPIHKSGEAVGDNIPVVVRFLDKSVKEVGGIAALGAAITLIRCYPGCIRNQPEQQKRLAVGYRYIPTYKRRNASIANTQQQEAQILEALPLKPSSA